MLLQPAGERPGTADMKTPGAPGTTVRLSAQETLPELSHHPAPENGSDQSARDCSWCHGRRGREGTTSAQTESITAAVQGG